jgi:hypothetical protein
MVHPQILRNPVQAMLLRKCHCRRPQLARKVRAASARLPPLPEPLRHLLQAPDSHPALPALRQFAHPSRSSSA